MPKFLPSKRWRFQYDPGSIFKSARERWLGRAPTLAPPIFICGCGHSGTSLILAVLGSHSRIFAVPFETSFAFVDHGLQKRLLAAFDRHTIADGKARWVEKTPRHIKAIKSLLDVAPDARVIIVLRDGRDVACSLRERTGNFAGGIKRWVDDNAGAEPFWKNPRVLVAKYEDFVERFEPSVRALTDFLGEPFEPGMLEFHKTERKFYSQKVEKPDSSAGKDHDQFRNWQINQPLFDGRGRWQKEMSPDEKAQFKAAAGERLIRYGYAIGPDW